MSGIDSWISPRMRTLRWIAAGYTTFFLVLGGSWVFAPRIGAIADPTERLLLGVQLAALPSFVLLAMLQGLWRIMDTPEAESPLLQRESRRFKINQRVMSNTVEQLLIFVPMHLALCLRIDPEYTWVLPVFTGIWCVGRLLFWIGYQIEDVWRAIGMDWTTGVSSLTALWLGSTLL